MKKLMGLALLLGSTFSLVSCGDISSDTSTSEKEVVTHTIEIDFGEASPKQTLILNDGEYLELGQYASINPKYECLSWSDGVNKYLPNDVIFVKSNMSIKGDFALKSLSYVLNENKDGYNLKRFSDDSASEVSIPNTYNGLPVKGILDSVFRSSNTIKKLIIGDNIETIEAGALTNLKVIEELVTPFFGENIEDNESTFGYLFGTSGNIQIIAVPETLKKVTITKSETISENAFVNLNNIEEVELKSAKTVRSHAFSSMSNLAKVTLNEGVKTLQSNSFSSLPKLETLDLPDSIEEFINPLTATGVKSLHFSKNLKNYSYRNESFKLESITVDSQNELFASKDGVLFDKNISKVITYPANKAGESFKLPDSVKEVGNNAFKYAKFTSIDLNKVEIIGEEAFRYSAIKSVTFPTTIRCIGKTAFSASQIQEVSFPETLDNVTSLPVGEFLFSSCSKLTKIVIPSYIDNISDYFVASDNVESIELKGSVKSIGTCAFAGTKIASFETTFKDNAVIGDRIFMNCGELKTWNVHFEDGVTTYPTFSGNGFGDYTPNIICDDADTATALKESWTNYKSFIGTEVSSSFVIENGVLMKFHGTAEEKDIVIPEGVTYINREAFAKNTYIETVVLPSTLIGIEQRIFDECPNLRSIEFAGDNPGSNIKYYYRDVNGVAEKTLKEYNWPSTNIVFLTKDETSKADLKANISSLKAESVLNKEEAVISKKMVISKDGATLYRGYVEEGEDFALPAGVKTIWNDCFSKQGNLTSIDLAGVETVNSNAFDNTGLTELVIPESLVNIGYCAFSYMDSLTFIKIESAAIIDQCGFSDNGYVTSIDLGDKIVSIGSCAFSNVATEVDPIESIIVPSTVIEVAEDAFADFNVSTINCCFSEDYASSTFECGADFAGNTDATVVFDYAA